MHAHRHRRSGSHMHCSSVGKDLHAALCAGPHTRRPSRRRAQSAPPPTHTQVERERATHGIGCICRTATPSSSAPTTATPTQATPVPSAFATALPTQRPIFLPTAPPSQPPTALPPLSAQPTTMSPSVFPTLRPTAVAELRSRVPTLAPTRAVLSLYLAIIGAAGVRTAVGTLPLRKGDAVQLELPAELQVQCSSGFGLVSHSGRADVQAALLCGVARRGQLIKMCPSAASRPTRRCCSSCARRSL